jgi:hypothetical protein
MFNRRKAGRWLFWMDLVAEKLVARIRSFPNFSSRRKSLYRIYRNYLLPNFAGNEHYLAVWRAPLFPVLPTNLRTNTRVMTVLPRDVDTESSQESAIIFLGSE